MQDIIQVKAVKRVDQNILFEEMQLRIGFVDISASGQVQLGEENLYVGCSGAINGNDRDHFFNLKTPASGRYLTLQKLAKSYFSLDEIYIFK